MLDDRIDEWLKIVANSCINININIYVHNN